MAKDSSKCPYCLGAGVKYVEVDVPDPQGGTIRRYASRPCICTLNGFVSKRYGMLAAVPDVTGRDCIAIGRNRNLGFNDYLFFGSEPKFLYILKAFIVLHYNYNKRFTVLSGADVAQKYAMVQADGVIPTVAALTDYDLVAFMCVSQINNRAIAPSSYELIVNRKRVKKATWLYASSSEELHSSKEFSSEGFSETLEPLVSEFPKIILSTIKCADFVESGTVSAKNTQRRNANDAAMM